VFKRTAVLTLSLLIVLVGTPAAMAQGRPHTITEAEAQAIVGACAVSAAIFLVLELNQPLDGLVKVSSAPFVNALQHLGQ
jgi:hypothetical protein